MAFGFIEKISNFRDFNFGSFSHNDGNYSRAQMLGVNVENFYEIDANGERTINTVKLMQAVKEAEAKAAQKNEEKAGQNDSFVKNASETKPEEAKDVKTEKETIEKEYKNAFTNYYNEMNSQMNASNQSKDVIEAWAEVKDMQFNLTKKGVTNATVIAGASEFITKLENTIAMTKAELEENKEYSIYNFTVDAQDDEDADLFENNPFYASIYATTAKDKEIAVA